MLLFDTATQFPIIGKNVSLNFSSRTHYQLLHRFWLLFLLFDIIFWKKKNWSSFGTFFLNHRFLYNCSNKPNKHASFISFRSTFPNNFFSAIYIWRWISQRSSFEDEYLDLFSLIFHTGAVTNKNIVRQLGFFSELICRIKLILFPLGFYFFPGRFWHP